MSESPYIPFYPSDWLAGTRGLTAAETGVYITLISLMYEREQPIDMPPFRLARLCGCTIPSLSKALATLIEEGKVIETDHGLWSPCIDKWAELWLKGSRRPAIPKRILSEVWDRYGACCVYCGDQSGPFDVDHVMPRSRGGSDDAENLVIACSHCNRSKGSRTPEEWMGIQ